ncbi:heparinase II/III domain-containing protein [Francisella salimarina]|uniref:heparinase II/III domain-containing protein n=1 Tax=Francisella salimarina TaxID=2599927 RepID=UPI003D8165A0
MLEYKLNIDYGTLSITISNPEKKAEYAVYILVNGKKNKIFGYSSYTKYNVDISSLRYEKLEVMLFKKMIDESEIEVKRVKVFYPYHKTLDLRSLKAKFSYVVYSVPGVDIFNNIFTLGMNKVSLKHPVKYDCKDRNMSMSLNGWRFLSSYWTIILDTGSIQSIQYIVEYIIDWYKNAIRNNTYRWYDMSVGLRSIHLSLIIEIYKLDKNILSIDQIYYIYRIINEHFDELMDPNKLANGNHGIWQLIGLGFLSKSLNLNKKLMYAESNLISQIKSMFDDNGINLENSPSYFQYNLDLIGRIQRQDVFINISQDIEKIIEQARRKLYWFVTPDGSYVRIGDTEGKPNFKLIHDTEDYKYKIDNDFLIIKDLYSSGYQIIKSKNMYFVFIVPHSFSHMHCHALSFVFFYKNIELFADPGKLRYDYSTDRAWLLSDASHNTLGLSSKNMSPKDIDYKDSEILPLKFEDAVLSLSGINKNEFFTHDRIIDYDFKCGTVNIKDVVNNNTQDNLQLRFLLGDGVSVRFVKGYIELICKQSDSILAKLIPDESSIKVKIKEAFISKKYNSKLRTSQIIMEYSNLNTVINTKILLQ